MKKIKRPFLILLICQAMIMLTAIGIYLFHHQNPYLDSYEFDNLCYTKELGATQELFPCKLKKGSYVIYLNYHADASSHTISVSSPELNELSLRSNPLSLDKNQGSASFSVELDRDVEELDIALNYSGEGTLQIYAITIAESGNYYKRNLFYALLLCAFLALGYYFVNTTAQNRKVILALSGIFLAASHPVFTNYLIPGHDIPFQLLRIEGIREGLAQGDFPVRIHPLWAQDYGYAVGVFYGNLFLYFPALLRMLGFSIQNSYKLYLLFVNLGTTLISYYCFRKIFKNSNLGLLGSLLYTLSIYRICDLYTRSAVGEYTALMFLPLIFYGFYLIFTDTDIRKNWLRHGVVVALGLTGLVQTHVLSCEMAAVFILITCIVLIKKIINIHVFKALASGAILTLLINLSFLVPFLSYYGTIRISSEEWALYNNTSPIQNKGMFPIQIFGFMQRFNGGDMTTVSGTAYEVTYTPGIALIIGICLFLYVLCCCKWRKDEMMPPLFCFILGCLSLWMSTCFFPWDAIASSSELANGLITKIQFPWRFLSVSTLFLTFITCYAVSVLQKELAPSVFPVLCGGLLAMLLVHCGWYYYDITLNADAYRVYDTYELNTMAMYSYEYLPIGTDPSLIQSGMLIPFGDVTLTAYEKTGTRILACVQTNAKGGYIDFPLNYYRDYQCRDGSGNILPVSAGFNSMVRVTFPADFNDSISVRFKEPLSWRICELISLFTLCASFAYLARRQWLAVKGAANSPKSESQAA